MESVYEHSERFRTQDILLLHALATEENLASDTCRVDNREPISCSILLIYELEPLITNGGSRRIQFGQELSCPTRKHLMVYIQGCELRLNCPM